MAQLLGSVSRLSGGVLGSAQGLSKALDCLTDTEVTVFGVPDRHTAADSPGWAPVAVELMSPLGPRFMRYVPALRSSLTQGDFDLVHTHLLWTYISIAGHRWSRITARSYVVSPEGMLDPWALAHSGWKKRLAGVLFEDAHLRGAACLHALNTAEFRSIRRLGLKNPVCVIPNGIDLPADGQRPPRPEWMPDDGSVGGAKHVLLYLGRIHAKKGLDNLIKAWGKIATRHPSIVEHWMLAIAGWGVDREVEQLLRLTNEESLQDTVVFPGPLYGAEKHAALTHASAFVLPSFSEGLPISVLEAWAHRLPVFMTDECNVPEGFEAQAAIRIATDVDEMASILASGLDRSDDVLAAMGARGRTLVETHFTWQQAAQDMRAVYEWLLGGGDPPSRVISN